MLSQRSFFGSVTTVLVEGEASSDHESNADLGVLAVQDTLSTSFIPTSFVAHDPSSCFSLVNRFSCRMRALNSVISLVPLPTSWFFMTLPDGRNVRRSARLNPNDSPDTFNLTRLQDGSVVRRSRRIIAQRLCRNRCLDP